MPHQHAAETRAGYAALEDGPVDEEELVTVMARAVTPARAIIAAE